MAVDFASPYYPYEKVLTGANTLKNSENIPHQLLTYLLDLPDANGYTPVDDNQRPRVRLIKYLWYDGANPLAEKLPTPHEKLSLLFDAKKPVINSNAAKAKHPKGYRLFWQKIVGQSQDEAQTRIMCYLGRIYSHDHFHTTIGVRFEISSNVNLETNTGTNAYARTYDIEQTLHEALDGVNITGIGTVSFSRADHVDNGSFAIYDEQTNVGRSVHCSISWSEGQDMYS